MTKTKERTSAAIIGLLDAIKLEGIKPLDQEQFEKKEELFNEHDTEDKSSSKFTVIEIDTANIVPWHMANRLEAYINEDSCEELIESIKNVGQQIPALIRKAKQKEHYELICGARRLFVCKKLGIKLLAAVVDFSDKEALLAMDAENRPRNDISPYERALDYKNWIEKGIYRNQAEICRTIGMKKSLFTQIFSLSEIDESIVRLFGHPNNLVIRWGYQLAKACKDLDRKRCLLEKVEEIKDLNLKPSAVYSILSTILKQSHLNQNVCKEKIYISKTSKINLQIQQGKDFCSIKIKDITDNQEIENILEILTKKLDLVES